MENTDVKMYTSEGKPISTEPDAGSDGKNIDITV